MVPPIASQTKPPTTAKPISISFGAKAKSKPSSLQAPKKRPHSALVDAESDSEGDGTEPQQVSIIDKSGSFTSNRPPVSNDESHLRRIPADKNVNFRHEAKKKYSRDGVMPKDYIELQLDPKSRPWKEREHDKKWGSDLRSHRDRDFNFKVDAQQAAEAEAIVPDQGDAEVIPGYRTHGITDQDIMDAIEHERTMKRMVEVHSVDGPEYKTHAHYLPYANETDHFKADLARRPGDDIDYNNVPVEEFGAAMLRGMGWREGDHIGRGREELRQFMQPPNKKVAQRPPLLGLGATEKPGDVGDEMGAWGKTTMKGKKKKTDLVYSPVVLRHFETGEKLTDEEFKKRKEEQEKSAKEGSWQDRRDRNLRLDEGRKKERSDRERSRIEHRREGGRSRERHRESRDPWGKPPVRKRSRSFEKRVQGERSPVRQEIVTAERAKNRRRVIENETREEREERKAAKGKGYHSESYIKGHSERYVDEGPEVDYNYVGEYGRNEKLGPAPYR